MKEYVSKLKTDSDFLYDETQENGNSFFHSLFMALKEYRELDKDERAMYIKKKRVQLAENMTRDHWFRIQNGNAAFIQIIDMMRIVVYMIPTFTEEEHQMDPRLLQILLSIMDSKEMDEKMIPKWDVECMKMEESSIQKEMLLYRMKNKWFEIFKQELTDRIDDLEKSVPPSEHRMTIRQKKKVIMKLASLSYNIFDIVVEKAFNEFRQDLESDNKWLNVFYIMGVLSETQYRFNILLIDETTGLPFEGQRFMDVTADHKPYVIFLYFPDYHFESLARSDGKTISRLFKHDDPFIQESLLWLNGTDTIPLSS